MLKIILCLIILIVVIGSSIGGAHLYKVSLKNKKEMAEYQGNKIEYANKSLDKVLVVYYSMSGNTKDIADRIKEKTGADIYEIKTLSEIKKGPLLHFDVKKQVKSGKYPEIQGDLPDLSGYDTVFIGSPVWWYTVSTPVLSFLDKVDLKNKKIVPFSTQGSNVGTFYDDFTKHAKNARILTYASFNNISEKYDEAVDNKISKWLNVLK